MLTSTVLTLVVIPVVYSLVDDVAGWLRRLVVRDTAAAPTPTPIPKPHTPEPEPALESTEATAVTG